ncbi:serine/threonine-protein kinase [Streptosporangium sp. NPDC000396]|uniref:serine/threonine-protein kinase n=1 Tax=Streptosporangium sp. NPDC000396 TaxID=3366185 RepID=UPI003690B609
MRAGTVLGGRYELVRKAGKGGQAELWQARDLETGGHVAAKLLGVGATKRYRREIRALRLLSPSERVAALHDTADHDGDPYLIMGWIDGDSLQEVLHHEPLPRLERVLHWTRQICEGLAHAHEEGVFHRDIKPANIMVSPGGDVTLVDFGIARFTDSTFTVLSEDRRPTGSYAYLAPERWHEHPGDHLSDLYALGCVLHQMLTGQPPFGFAGPYTDWTHLRDKHLHTPPVPPAQSRPGIPDVLNRLVIRLLAKSRAERPGHAREVIEQLSRLIHPPTTQVDDGTRGSGAPEAAGPYVDPGFIERLRTADARIQQLTVSPGPDAPLTLEVQVERAELIGLSGDVTGAIREYDRLAELYTRVHGPHHPLTLAIHSAGIRWTFAKRP